MSKERLEEAKDVYGAWLDAEDENGQNAKADEFIYRFGELLLGKAERVQELVKAHELKDLEHQGLVRQIKEKDEQNKRYREELDILGEVINSATNADKLNEEYEKLKRLEESQ